ncbi:MAG: YebC/PmpR family DNA-binding transcriptional regulator [Desulfobacterales bacterium]|nr:YebC/PmpR family DNA-binding transcriptional regulator [Desulfobacterales bacterium]
MSGHNKWSTIKHKKGAADAKRGRIFTKLIKEITIAARMGGGDPLTNPRLRQAVLAAKTQNMPKDNLERAVKKGTGELEGVNYEDVIYEGYGPAGAAVMIEAITDNKNRAVANIRHIFSKRGGNLAENGCVSWMFHKKGYIVVDKQGAAEDMIMETALNAGADDVQEDETSFEIITASEDFENVKNELKNANLTILSSEITMLPQTYVSLEGKEAEQMVKLMDALDECEDVNKVYTNADIPDEMV